MLSNESRQSYEQQDNKVRSDWCDKRIAWSGTCAKTRGSITVRHTLLLALKGRSKLVLDCDDRAQSLFDANGLSLSHPVIVFNSVSAIMAGEMSHNTANQSYMLKSIVGHWSSIISSAPAHSPAVLTANPAKPYRFTGTTSDYDHSDHCSAMISLYTGEIVGELTLV